MQEAATDSAKTPAPARCAPHPPPASTPPVSLRLSQAKHTRLGRTLDRESSNSKRHQRGPSEGGGKGDEVRQPVAGEDDMKGRWHSGMKQVVLGCRLMRALRDEGHLKDPHNTYCRGVKMQKSIKADIDGDKDTVTKHCLTALHIVEQCKHAAAERRLAATVQNGGTKASFERPDQGAKGTRNLASPERCALVFGLFQSVEAVNTLGSIYKAQLLPELQILRLSVGDTVFEQWDYHSMVYVIVRGTVELKSTKAGVPFRVGKFGVGEVIGSPLAEKCQTTARCTDDSILIGLDGEHLKAIATSSRDAERMAKEAFLKDVAAMSLFSDSDLNVVGKLFKTCTLKENEVLCQEGTRANHLYVVKRGFFRLLKAFLPKASSTGDGIKDRASSEGPYSCGGRRLMHFELGEIGPKEMLGESGLFHNEAEASSGVVGTTARAKVPMSAATGEYEAGPLYPPSSASEVENNAEGKIYTPATPKSARVMQAASATRNMNVLSATNTPSPTRPKAGVKGDADPTAIFCSPSRPRQRKKGYHIVSAVASRGGAQVYVASIFDLKLLLRDLPSLRCFIDITRRVHEARAKCWDAQALAEQLREQIAWEGYKRKVISETVRLDRLKHIMGSSGIGCSVHRWGGSGDDIDS